MTRAPDLVVNTGYGFGGAAFGSARGGGSQLNADMVSFGSEMRRWC